MSERPRLSVRQGLPRDATAVAEVHVASWKVAYRGLVDDDYLDGLDPPDHVDGWWNRLASPLRHGTTDVALLDGRLVGFVVYGPSRDPDAQPGTGELYSLYVHPEVWGQGVGKALFRRCCQALRIAGHQELSLWAKVGHERSRVFYEAQGLRGDGAEKLDEPPGGVTLQLVRMRGSLKTDEPWLTPRALRRALARAAVFGLIVAAFPSALVSGEPAALALALLGLITVPPALVEARWRALGRPTASAALLAGVGVVATLAALLVSLIYVVALWTHGSVGAAIATVGAELGGADLALILALSTPLAAVPAVGALGDPEEWQQRPMLTVTGLLALAPALLAVWIAIGEGERPLVACLLLVAVWVAAALSLPIAATLLRILYAAADGLEARLWRGT
ncbi:MAG: N-acetyltransferase family protein [Planctomycetota bacterium]